MKKFMDEDFLLTTDTSIRLYNEIARKLPIIDYHCHINPREIYEDRRFDNIAQIWLEGDHYKWRFMRSCGVDERYITGDATDEDKFVKWAECLEKAIGNPLYHWSHMELSRYFGYDGILNARTAKEVWELCNERLREGALSARGIIAASNVSLICTTDDPVDDLSWHKKLAEDEGITFRVLPAWRPDRALNIEKPDYTEYIGLLAKAAGADISSFADLKKVLISRMDFFESLGCKMSDHGLEFVGYLPAEDLEIEEIFAKRLDGQELSGEETLKFKTAFMLFAGEEYSKRDWVMQLHFGCLRNNNTEMFGRIGADTGFDCIGGYIASAGLTGFLDALNSKGALPKTVLYSLNQQDNAVIDSIAGCFQEGCFPAKIQHGSAWWFNDHKSGMREHLKSLAALGNLSGFIGMLTDSRSFLSYTRHEYFRRILCDLIGGWVENGEYPDDEEALKTIIEGICFNNAVDYFDLT